ncbi:MAG: 2-amino-4-hydroxy-6-hydroxymethyldihydropteridine diphosphokinase [Chloroflexi bacterium]|nr:2-amino-4-hydroxy-6-hydroxymethyldihydropteridine diphosphokinase [Chloroflexota bacterium]
MTRARTVRAYIGLGGNQGPVTGTLAAAVRDLDALPMARVRGVSRLYRTRPVGVTDQPDFLNAAVALDVRADDDPAAAALRLLTALKSLEADAGRRTGVRWGPRPLDLDLLVFGRHAIHARRPPAAHSADPARPSVQWLEVPHPSAAERAFVLAPLVDLAPGLVPPGWDRTVRAMLRARLVDEGSDAVAPVGSWDATAGRWWDHAPEGR